MIRMSAIARLLGSAALVGLVACSAEHTTGNDGSGEPSTPEESIGNETVETPTTTGTPEAKAPATVDFATSNLARSLKIEGSFGLDIDTTTPPPAPPAPPAPPETCTGIGGDGSITVTDHSVSAFTRIDSKLAGNLVIKEGQWFDVKVETDANIQGSVKVEVNNGVLLVEGQGSFCASKLQVTITLPVFRAIKLEGSGSVVIDKTGIPGDVDLVLKGSGSIKFDGKALALNTSLEGSGKIVLGNGSAVSTNVEINGSGTVDATGFGIGSVTKKISVDGSFKFSL